VIRDKNFWLGLGRVSHLWFLLGGWKFPQKMSNFSIFSLQVKKNLFGLGQKVPGSKAGWPLIYCGSKVNSGQVRAHLYRTIIFLNRKKLLPLFYILITENSTDIHFTLPYFNKFKCKKLLIRWNWKPFIDLLSFFANLAINLQKLILNVEME